MRCLLDSYSLPKIEHLQRTNVLANASPKLRIRRTPMAHVSVRTRGPCRDVSASAMSFVCASIVYRRHHSCGCSLVARQGLMSRLICQSDFQTTTLAPGNYGWTAPSTCAQGLIIELQRSPKNSGLSRIRCIVPTTGIVSKALGNNRPGPTFLLRFIPQECDMRRKR